MSVIGVRLKAARARHGLSQERLGLDAGLEAESASARMNRYEVGARVPPLELMERVAKVLRVPTSYFYEADDLIAELLLAVGELQPAERAKLLELARSAGHASVEQASRPLS